MKNNHSRAIRTLSALALLTVIPARAADPAPDQSSKPNIILCMTDDQGWGDVSYNGLKKIQTPNLDAMAAAGLRFNRFYAAHPSCSPTRASVMTGRNPNRGGTFWPGMTLRKQEITIAQAVKKAGYTTGHFGKWHLSGGKPGMGRALPAEDPLHPGNFGFDEWYTVSNWFDTDWTFSNNGTPEKVPGDGSDAIVAAALKFIGKNAKAEAPFLAVIWFGSPHVPLEPTAADLEAAGGSPYYGEMIGVDRSMGTLRDGLRKLGIADNTLLWFNSDNGAWVDEKAAPDAFGSNGVLRGHKGELWEGGIRVPGIIEWPARIKRPAVTEVAACTSDIYPTIVDLLHIDIPNQVRPLDGISLVPLLDGSMKERPQPIGFWHHGSETLEGGPAAWNDNQYKLHKRGPDEYELYDLLADISEKNDLAATQPEILERMKAELKDWQLSVLGSIRGEDYPEKKVLAPEPYKAK
ncbi:MAG: sulfatase-like hydrolase/transferase [Verrucomicrobia bacterium]|nr:sulfatase-like hydrolase/transferase [Verrucomicrobiota bacterium]MDA1005253.1 sulfatase-like hydrolase/transferase [Verrucomicrobiota bacterium]